MVQLNCLISFSKLFFYILISSIIVIQDRRYYNSIVWSTLHSISNPNLCSTTSRYCESSHSNVELVNWDMRHVKHTEPIHNALEHSCSACSFIADFMFAIMEELHVFFSSSIPNAFSHCKKKLSQLITHCNKEIYQKPGGPPEPSP